MSRCYPFPTPDYLLNEFKDLCLIESIKETEEVKKDRKHKRTKKRRNESETEEGRRRKHRHKRRRKDEGDRPLEAVAKILKRLSVAE